MNPFEYLGSEHRELTRVLCVLEQLIRAVAAGAAIDRQELEIVVDYFREVGDMAHHDKEETLLVPALVRHHMDWFDGPLAELRKDHGQERYLTRSLRHTASKQSEWSDEDKRHFVSIGVAYSEFLRAHMGRENEVWFVAAARVLPEAVQLELVESFQRFDQELTELKDFVLVRERALSLLDKYGV